MSIPSGCSHACFFEMSDSPRTGNAEQQKSERSAEYVNFFQSDRFFFSIRKNLDTRTGRTLPFIYWEGGVFRMLARENGLTLLADAAVAAAQGVDRFRFENAFQRLTRCSDAQGITRLLSRHRLSPLLYSNVERFETAADTPEGILNGIKEAYFSTLAFNALQERHLRELLRATANSGADVIPVKGVSTAQTWYQYPGVRFAGDLDILVRKKDLQRFDQAASATGFERSPTPDRHWTRTYIQTEVPGVIVECQWNLWFNFRLGYNFDSLWSNTEEKELMGIPVRVLNPAHEILLSAFHFASHHYYRGPLLWLHDIMLMLPKNPEAAPDLAAELQRFAAEYRCRRLLRSIFLLVEGFWCDNREGWSSLFGSRTQRGESSGDALLHRIAVRSMLNPAPWRQTGLDLKMLLCALLLLEGRSPAGYFRRRFGMTQTPGPIDASESPTR